MIETKWFYYTSDLYDVLTVRQAVFQDKVLGQKDDDFYGYHVVVYDSGKPASTGRLTVKDGIYEISGVGTVEEYRNHGYGDLVLRMLIRRSFDLGADQVVARVPENLMHYFLRLDFVYRGKVFQRERPFILMSRHEDVVGVCSR